MTTTTINIAFSRNAVTNELTMLDKLGVIKQIRDLTFGDLKVTKDMVDAFDEAVRKSVPKNDVIHNKIVQGLRTLEGNDLLDVLRFVNVTNNTASANHRCGDECRHECEYAGCERMIQFHDEPFCFTHSPDEGSSFKDYDSRNNRSF